MARITENTIEKIRLRADIVDTVSDYVELKKRGRNFFGLCPFHNEKTGSFSVSEDKQIYKCFGCGAGGSVFNFIMDIEKVEFPESIEILAKKIGIKVEYEQGQSKESASLNSELFLIHDLANTIYTDNIEETPTIIDYLHKRGLEGDTISNFEIGYSKTSYDQVLKTMQKKNFSSKSMKESGLFVETKKGYIDRFRNRVMFPIHDYRGQVKAFGGRTMDKENPAKYMNSPETSIYIKSKLLYGLWKTKKNIINKKDIIIVEGYMDFLKLYQSGIDNVVATSGTAFTQAYATQIKRLCDKAYLLPDGDDAGRKAAIRAGYILLQFGIEANIVEIPDGIDPDDWVTQTDINSIKEKIYNAINVVDFHFKTESENVKTDVGKTKFINDCLVNLKNIEDPVYKELQIKKLSEITNIREQSILSLLDKKSKKRTPKEQEEKNIKKNSRYLEQNASLENDLIKLCFSKNQNTRLLVYDDFKPEWLENKFNVKIFNEVYIHLNSENEIDPAFILEKMKEKEDRNHLSTLLFESDNTNLDSEMAKECINRLKKKFMTKKIEEIRTKLKVESDNDKIEKFIIEISTLEKEMNN